MLEKQGAATLVHPIRGRLQNMICTGANFRHEADMIDYVALD
ncbi:Mu-like prophage DNA circulation protein [Rodentibacter pneumotropicus]|uniref:Mu-like prophage DNA circulation protein n=1 Tax=Rodentibacter pneumotropicus TaxID=758 RepID=A0A448MPU6_9PAST|nr:Mu-like prophage DNA circulation protein [Rodentibacter pneumotropicus]